jgi:hypothetical protein
MPEEPHVLSEGGYLDCRILHLSEKHRINRMITTQDTQ